MNREYVKWQSPKLDRDMELLVFGHSGARVLVFPTSCGRFFDWENRGMIHALSHHIDNGWVQLFCLDSVDAESWWNFNEHPSNRARRHLDYQSYVIEEVLPFTKEKNDNDFVIALGASMGAYHAINIALRFPDEFNRTIGMSGPYDFAQMSGPYSVFKWVFEYYDEYIHQANPVALIQTTSDEEKLEHIRNLDIIFPIGKDDPLYGSNQMLSLALWDKDIWHAFRTWDGFAHDWPHWHEMVLHYIGGAETG
ncbi:MAG: esterase family protein [Cyanobacteria bacterium HKST-UBA02]|nr:esterase family protein [Cyanobacteria bacterium HKST-UBA02]